MRKGQKLKTNQNIEVCLFPMEHLNVSQGPGYLSDGSIDKNSYSHRASWAIDNVGEESDLKDEKGQIVERKISEVYAPVTLRLVKKYESSEGENYAHLCIFQSTEKVKLAGYDEPDFLDIILEHCDNIDFLTTGNTYSQGSLIYKEGIYGPATGTHLHIEARKRGSNPAPEDAPSYNMGYFRDPKIWSLKDNEPIQKIFYLNGTQVLVDVPAIAGVPKWKTFDATPFNPTGKEDGWYEHNGLWYYVINEQKAKGWQQIEGCWYYLDPENDCIMKTGWLCTKDKETNKEEWYYFGPSGVMQGDCWVDNDNFYVGSDGKMLTSGWTKINGYFYYFKDKNRDTTDRFAAFAHGQKVTNTWIPGESWYYVKSDGKMAANETVNINGTDYHFDQSGACLNP